MSMYFDEMDNMAKPMKHGHGHWTRHGH